MTTDYRTKKGLVNWNGMQTDVRKISKPDLTYESYLMCRKLADDIKKASKLAKGTLLDIGAGMSPYRRIFEGKVNRYITLDFFKEKGFKPDVVAHANALPFKSGSIDTILCTQVLEHLNDPAIAVKEMFRVLKKGGVCICSTHMAMVLHCEPNDYFRFTKYGLKELFKDFKETDIKENGGAVLCMAQLFNWATFYSLGMLALPSMIMLNIIIPTVDKIFYSDKLTVNYVVIARK